MEHAFKPRLESVTGLAIKAILPLAVILPQQSLQIYRRDPPSGCLCNCQSQLPSHSYSPSFTRRLFNRVDKGKGPVPQKLPLKSSRSNVHTMAPQNALSLYKNGKKRVVSQLSVLTILQIEYNGKIRWTLRRQYGRMVSHITVLNLASIAYQLRYLEKSYINFMCLSCLLCKKKKDNNISNIFRTQRIPTCTRYNIDGSGTSC